MAHDRIRDDRVVRCHVVLPAEDLGHVCESRRIMVRHRASRVPHVQSVLGTAVCDSRSRILDRSKVWRR